MRREYELRRNYIVRAFNDLGLECHKPARRLLRLPEDRQHRPDQPRVFARAAREKESRLRARPGLWPERRRLRPLLLRHEPRPDQSRHGTHRRIHHRSPAVMTAERGNRGLLNRSSASALERPRDFSILVAFSRIGVLKFLQTIFLITMFALPGHGLLLIGPDESDNLEAPPDKSPWSYVARLENQFGARATGVYLGNRYLLTANHVDADINVVHLNGVNYTINASFTPLVINGSDLRVMRITTDPGLPPLPLISATESELNQPSTIIGYGIGKAAEIPRQGWNWGDDSTRLKRWGTNVTTPIQFRGPETRLLYVQTAFDPAQGAGGGSASHGRFGVRIVPIARRCMEAGGHRRGCADGGPGALRPRPGGSGESARSLLFPADPPAPGAVDALALRSSDACGTKARPLWEHFASISADHEFSYDQESRPPRRRQRHAHARADQ